MPGLSRSPISGRNISCRETVNPPQTGTIRRAALSDLQTVRKISADAYIPAYQSTIGAVPKPAFEDYRPRIEQGQVWLLEAAGEVVGVMVLEENPDHLLVYSIAVRPDCQGRGYSTALLRCADQRARTCETREVRLYTEPAHGTEYRLVSPLRFRSNRRSTPSQPSG